MRSLIRTLASAARLLPGHTSAAADQICQPCLCQQALHLLQQQRRLQHTAHATCQAAGRSRTPLEQGLVSQLSAAVGGKAAVSDAVLQQHGVDEGYQVGFEPVPCEFKDQHATKVSCPAGQATGLRNELYLRTNSATCVQEPMPPDIVLFPQDTQQVCACVCVVCIALQAHNTSEPA